MELRQGSREASERASIYSLELSPKPGYQPGDQCWKACCKAVLIPSLVLMTPPPPVGIVPESAAEECDKGHLFIQSQTFIKHLLYANGGFPGGPVVKNLPANAGDTGDEGSIPGPGRSPEGGNGNTLHFYLLFLFLLRKVHGQRSLVGYSPWGPKEWDTTEPKASQGCCS